ncbi:MAG: radical SAM protein [Mariniphaga sp.]
MKKPKLIIGWQTKIIRKRVQWFIIVQAFKFFRNPLRAVLEMKRLRGLHARVHGSSTISKYIKSGNQFFWNSDYCGYPSKNLKSLIRSEFLRNGLAKTNGSARNPTLQTLIWGITNRCSFSCVHCYEWENIAENDKLDRLALKNILAIFIANGLRHIQFSGGEPMVRFNDLIELIRSASPSMDCWVLTSGFGLTAEKAALLKTAGLTGVNISLDHWDPQLHNTFRNNEKSYVIATDAVQNCLESGLMVSLSLCATREFVTQENLMNYATLAKYLGVHFIRILEPRAAGKFALQKIQLENHQVSLLSEFTIRLNTDPRYKDFPIVTFFGYHQRIMGCFGAGNRYIYADPNGDVHACPFCRGIAGNLLEDHFDLIIANLKRTGCHQFVTHA